MSFYETHLASFSDSPESGNEPDFFSNDIAEMIPGDSVNSVDAQGTVVISADELRLLAKSGFTDRPAEDK